MNPMQLVKLKPKFGEFRGRHPKFIQFFTNEAPGNLKEGSIFEVKITNPDGKELSTNIKITAEDAQLIGDLFNALK